jgi:hypothetical protein
VVRENYDFLADLAVYVQISEKLVCNVEATNYGELAIKLAEHVWKLGF